MNDLVKVKPSHTQRTAFVYIRQSSPAQVEYNRESTARQYALVEKARELGLEQVKYVDSAGLGALIEIHRKTKAKGGGLKLCSLGQNLRQALEIARLLPIFETCPTETAAVASF